MIIVIVGPTAVGKTKLSIELAKKYNGEIINADSTQVYKDLNIATAKVTKEEMENIPHHILDIKEINEDYTVFDYQKDCRLAIADILKRGKTPIMVGGTGLYIKAALYDYQFKDDDNSELYTDLTNEELYNKLLEVDPETTIHKNNRKRVVRALNYYKNNNEKFSLKEKTDKILYDVVFIGLTTNRDDLYNRINKRVDVMLENGLMEEAKDIYNRNIRSKAVMTPIGYKELFEYFDGKKSLEESVNLIKQRSRKYAKRQYTWFNHQIPVNWFDVDFNNLDNTIDNIIKFLDKKEDINF